MTKLNQPTRRAAKKAATREKILAAARAAFEVGGYEAATMRTLAADIGMSTGALFANFDSKAAIYRELFGHDPISPEVGAQLVGVIRRALDSDARPFDQVHARNVLARVGVAL